MAPESEDNATQHRTVSGKLVVGLMFAFGLLMIGTLYVYWYFHTGPFRPLQEAIAQAIPKSSPRVIGGKHKSHQPGSKNRLRIIVQVAYDPRSEEHASERNALAKSILELAKTHHDVSPYEIIEIHLEHRVAERPAETWSALKTPAEWDEFAAEISDRKRSAA